MLVVELSIQILYFFLKPFDLYLRLFGDPLLIGKDDLALVLDSLGLHVPVFVPLRLFLRFLQLHVYLSLLTLQQSQALSQLLQLASECLVLLLYADELVPSVFRLEALELTLELGDFFDVLGFFVGLEVLGGVFLIGQLLLLENLALSELVVLLLLPPNHRVLLSVVYLVLSHRGLYPLMGRDVAHVGRSQPCVFGVA